MNGEVKHYRLNDPMGWKEFKAMPDDLRITYINLLRKKFNVPGNHIAKMMGINNCSYSQEISRLGISEGKNCRGKCTKWDKEGFYAWWHGVDALPTPVPERLIITQEDIDELEEAIGVKNLHNKVEAYAEDDLPFEEPDPIPVDNFTPVPLGIPVTATPCNGSMQFKCPADQALNTLAQLLGQTNCAISIMWRVIEEGGAEE